MSLWVRSARRGRQRSSLVGVAFLVALSLALGACGDEELKRQDYSTAIAPERCGGSGGGPC
ncbi:MAG: hypothetical protein OXG64_04855 [Chloroflexi bacterium]|nr:hypothetical protein [Chloroflexota bacterium]